MTATEQPFDGRSQAEKKLGLVPLTAPGIQMLGLALILPGAIRRRVVEDLSQEIDATAVVGACNNHPDISWWVTRYPGDVEHLVHLALENIKEEALQVLSKRGETPTG